jgi:hypothetical protein
MGNIWFSSPYENKSYTINHSGPYGVWRMVRKPAPNFSFDQLILQPRHMSDPSTEARTLLALEALQNNPKLSIRRAAKLYKISEHRLRRRQHGIQSRRDWIPKSRRLSDLEEQIIVQFILDLDPRGFPPRPRDVEEMANRLLADRDASPVGKRWASNFVKRHKKLKARFFS